MFSGQIELNIIGASNLPSTHDHSCQFVKVGVNGKEVFRTQAIKNSVNPVWNKNEVFEREGANQLSFEIFDAKNDDLIGECFLEFDDVLADQIGKNEKLSRKEQLDPEGELEIKIWLRERLELSDLQDHERVERVYRFRGHNFKTCFFTQPTYCTQCEDFLWGFGKQGMRCSGCIKPVHKRCHKHVVERCPLATEEAGGFNAKNDHNFKAKVLLKPTFCVHDGTLLSMLGYQCKLCKIIVHGGCRDLVPKTCGLNTLAMTLITVESEAEAEEEIEVEFDDETLKTKVAVKVAERLKALGENN